MPSLLSRWASPGSASRVALRALKTTSNANSPGSITLERGCQVTTKSKHLVESEALAFLERFTRPQLSLEKLPDLRAFAKNLFQEPRRAAAASLAVLRETAPGLECGPDVPLIVYAPKAASSP